MPKHAPLHQSIETMRAMSWALFRERRFGARASDVLILMGVMIGEAEGKPLSAFKLAELVGVPRPTVMRRLEKLARDGLLMRDRRKKIHADRQGAQAGCWRGVSAQVRASWPGPPRTTKVRIVLFSRNTGPSGAGRHTGAMSPHLSTSEWP
ncbi:helix-turn-helix domain-containing protein [Burkholderia gladioli]|nr:helix-turn-helix domain-containing protein [Burkholderia gladioli]MDN7805419.1 helix-turn-helix domain-containing protein [Burkholderia gladioli]